MPNRRRATLRSAWWKAQIGLVRFCFACGGRLAKRYVAVERKRRLVCRACGQITYTNPKVVAGLIPTLPDGRVVLARRDIEPAKGKWTYPAGYQEIGESVAHAAERETWEEIRARVRALRPLGVYSYPDAGVVTIVFVARLKAGQRPSPGEESQEVAVFRPGEIPWRQLAFRSTAHALRDWIKLVKQGRS